MPKCNRSIQALKSTLIFGLNLQEALYKNNIQLNLSRSERHILTLFIKNMGHCVGYDTLLHGEINNANSLRNTITTLRKKCPDLIIKNIKDTGYSCTQR